ncbi:MAG: FMN-binding protein [bacterium]|nr:FMN-binding protein [bacterium]
MKIKIIGIIFIIFIAGILIGCPKNDIDKFKTMKIQDIDPGKVNDGDYIGEVPFMERYVYKVEVHVESGRITEINVLENGTGNKWAKNGLKVIDRIVEKQTPNVDAISGATVTSKALMKCVELALEKGKKK